METRDRFNGAGRSLKGEELAVKSARFSLRARFTEGVCRLSSLRWHFLQQMRRDRDEVLASKRHDLTLPLMRRTARITRRPRQLATVFALAYRTFLATGTWVVLSKLQQRIRAARAVEASGLFDVNWYVNFNHDLVAAGVDPVVHFVLIGAFEGRRPSPLFDTRWYLNQYPEVAADGFNPLLHYVVVGAARGFNPNPFFDTDWYLARNPDVARSGMNPLLHYVRFGAAEGRQPSARFEPLWYLDRYPDVAAAKVAPLTHFLLHGQAEGRSPAPKSEMPLLLHGQAESRSRTPTSETLPASDAPLQDRRDYQEWVRRYDTLDKTDRAAIQVHISELARRPLISIAVPVHDADETYLREMIESVRRQIYPDWELCLCDDASTKPHVEKVLRECVALDPRIKFTRREVNGHISAATNSAIELATGEYIALLDHDDVLSERALYEIVVELNAHPEADVIYSDSDCIDDIGRRWGPYFKTDWDPDLMLAHNMVSHLGVYRRSLVEGIGRLRVGLEGSQDYDLMLRAAEATVPDRIRHVPAILYHWRRNASCPSFSESSLERCVVAARRAIRGHLQRLGKRARVEAAPKVPSYTRVVYALPADPPLVSVIVPARDRPDLLASCADGILTRTDYEPLELLIVDNDSAEPEKRRLLSRLAEDCRVRIIRHTGEFNHAAMSNRAVREARGEVAVLLKDDMRVVSPSWLEEMASQVLRGEVGAVGAKLLYPDGRVRHAGVMLDVAHGTSSFFHLSQGSDVGYIDLLALVRRVSAVASCIAVRRSVYLDLGGLDEINVPADFSDIDLCLRLGERGYAVVWTPHAELYELECSPPNADSIHSAELQRGANYLRRRWGAVFSCDPHYNPNCSLHGANFEPAFPPRRHRPWLPIKERSVKPT